MIQVCFHLKVGNSKINCVYGINRNPFSIYPTIKINIHKLINVMNIQSSEDTIQTFIRIAPRRCSSTGYIHHAPTRLSLKGARDYEFQFDQVFGPGSTQQDIFHIVGKNLADNCIKGYNSCVFVYGQTGSGKTYTMTGDKSNPGLLSLTLQFLLNRMAAQNREFISTCSFFEVYNEQLFDLLDPKQKKMVLREDLKSGVFIQNIQETQIKSLDSVEQILKEGICNRHIGSTNMNRESSRSHSVFTFQMQSRLQTGGSGNVRNSKLHFVDLAGSQRQKKTASSGDRLKEAGNINKSLTTLGMVISTLSEKRKHSHVPYRDSKLTFFLRDSLSGNSRTSMIATISGSPDCFQQTLSTLKFAQRAKMIKTSATINESKDSHEALRREINELRNRLTEFQNGKALFNSQPQQAKGNILLGRLQEQIDWIKHDLMEYLNREQNWQFEFRSFLCEGQEETFYFEKATSIANRMSELAKLHKQIREHAIELNRNILNKTPEFNELRSQKEFSFDRSCDPHEIFELKQSFKDSVTELNNSNLKILQLENEVSTYKNNYLTLLDTIEKAQTEPQQFTPDLHQIQSLKVKKVQLQAQNNKLSQQVETLQVQNVQLRQDIQTLEDSIEYHKHAIKAQSNRHHEVECVLAQTFGVKQEGGDLVAAIKMYKMEKDSEITCYKQTIQRYFQESQKKIERSRQDISEHQRTLTEKNKQIMSLLLQRQNLRKGLDSLQDQLSKQVNDNLAMNEQMRQIAHDLQECRGQLSQQQFQFSLMHSRIQQEKQEKTRLQNQSNARNQVIYKLEHEMQRIQHLEEELSTAKKDSAATRMRARQLQSNNKHLEAENFHLRKELTKRAIHFKLERVVNVQLQGQTLKQSRQIEKRIDEIKRNSFSNIKSGNQLSLLRLENHKLKKELEEMLEKMDNKQEEEFMREQLAEKNRYITYLQDEITKKNCNNKQNKSSNRPMAPGERPIKKLKLI